MTSKNVQKRNEKAQNLRVIAVDKGTFFVESEEGKICYRVELNSYGASCTCGDYAKNSRQDENFHCKHIMAVLNSETNDVLVTEFLARHKPKLDDHWITNIQGNDFVKYAGLLDLGHQRGLLKLEVEAVQYPTKDNQHEAICKAVAVSKTGEVFSDIGDANPNNTNEKVSKHLLRMASTRAKARVLRDFNNIGMTALEELGDFDEVVVNNTVKKTTSKVRKTPAKKDPVPIEKGKPAAKKTEKSSSASKKGQEEKTVKEEKQQSRETAKPTMSVAQKKAIINLAQRRGISEEDLQAMATDNFDKGFEFLSPTDASKFIRQLQQSA
ncbi:MAG: SWIM zinc finger family protein [Deltaproteobacteria bacterium]|nr:SWIM zinc finger family protein [Deltaproteobacteria bacterium]